MPYVKNKQNGLVSVADAARTVGLSYWRFWARVYNSQELEAPQTAVGLRVYYDEQQLKRVVEQVAELRTKGVLIMEMPFGKHRGRR